MKPLSVTELNSQLKAVVEVHFTQVVVQGEISALVKASSGHIYFTLKDENAQIKVTLWKGNAQKLKFTLENGLAVIIYGGVKVYSPRGEYNLDCANIEPLGAGALALAYEQLKKKLAQKGYFDQETKKQLPRFPKNIALITSKTGAVLQDMLKVATKRWPFIKFVVFDTLVQGNLAASMIANKIEIADSFDFDLIIIARGGGSAEDLWCFNEENVADAIFKAKTPIVSAVGHETDVSLSDFVADVRAPTPSAAIEMILPDVADYRQLLDDYADRLQIVFNHQYSKKLQYVREYKEIMARFAPIAKIENFHELSKFLKQKIDFAMSNKILYAQNIISETKAVLDTSYMAMINKMSFALSEINSKLQASNPEYKLQDGYAMVVANGKKVALESLKVGQKFELQTAKSSLRAIVENKKLDSTI